MLRHWFGCRCASRTCLTCKVVLLRALCDSKWGRECLRRGARLVPILRDLIVDGRYWLLLSLRLRHSVHISWVSIGGLLHWPLRLLRLVGLRKGHGAGLLHGGILRTLVEAI